MWVVEGERRAHASGGIGSDGQGGEGHDGKSWVRRWASGDEGRCDGVDHVESQGSVKGTGPRVDHETSGGLPGLVSGLDGEDDCGGLEVFGTGDVLSSTGVGRDTDILNERGQRDERLGVGVGERVGARSNRVVPKGTRDEGDVVGLVSTDLGDSASNPVWETGIGEIALGEVGKSIGAEIEPSARKVSP